MANIVGAEWVELRGDRTPELRAASAGGTCSWGFVGTCDWRSVSA
jgi:hypothetical protein